MGDFVGTTIDNRTKCKLLTNHLKRGNTLGFPSSMLAKTTLRYNWLNSVLFLVYSERYGFVFCIPCILLDTSEISQKSQFAKKTGFYHET